MVRDFLNGTDKFKIGCSIPVGTECTKGKLVSRTNQEAQRQCRSRLNLDRLSAIKYSVNRRRHPYEVSANSHHLFEPSNHECRLPAARCGSSRSWVEHRSVAKLAEHAKSAAGCSTQKLIFGVSVRPHS